jgi:hypothetical protein
VSAPRRPRERVASAEEIAAERARHRRARQAAARPQPDPAAPVSPDDGGVPDPGDNDVPDPGLPARYAAGREFLADFRLDQALTGCGIPADWPAWAALLADALGDLLDAVDAAGALTPAART